MQPAKFEVRAEPGQVLVGAITVRNTGDKKVDVRVEPEEWSRGATGGRSTVPWLMVKPQAFALRGDGKKQVTFEAQVPEDATGELAAQIFFTTETKNPTGEVVVRARQGAILYIAIRGTEEVEGAIGRVRLEYLASTAEAPKPDLLQAWVEVVNQGNVHLRPHGDVVILDAAGAERYRVPIQSGWGILPGERNTYLAQGHQIYLEPGQYQAKVELHIGELFDQPKTLSFLQPFEVGEAGKIEERAP